MPRTKLTRSTKSTLYFLRFYLVCLMAQRLFRFIRAFG